MFDPTIFDNLKVAFENHLYDLDNLDGRIRIIGRKDRLEMSVMAREFAITFMLTDAAELTAEIGLEASLQDLAAEILEVQGEHPGCRIRLRFYMQVEAAEECGQIQHILQNLWTDLTPVQTLSYVYGENTSMLHNTAELRFNRKINEDQMGDIPELIEHVLLTLDELRCLRKQGRG